MTMESYLDYVDRDPFEFYARKLADGAVHWDEKMSAWLVLGYDEAKFVEIRDDLFRHPYNEFPAAGDIQGGPRSLLLLQGQEHAALHKFLLSRFTPALVRQYRERWVGPLVERRLAAIAHLERIDLDREFAGRLPSDVIAALLGLDWHDEEVLAQCRAWNSLIFRYIATGGQDEQVVATALGAAAELNEMLLPVIRARKAHPEDDLISVLWEHGPSVLQPWGEEEMLAQSRLMFLAGSDTTAHFLANAVYVLLTRPDIQERLRAEPSKVADFVDEVLRFYGPVPFRVRIARTDVVLGGVQIKAGDKIHPINSAANRDPHHYEDPHSIQVDRPRVQDHLAFNAGPRYCVGAALARGESTEVIQRLLHRYESLSLDPNAEQPHPHGFLPWSFRPLHAVLRAAAAVG